MITIKEIAKQLSISPSTVSIVLNGKAKERKISEKTQQLIMEYAAAHGYYPNISARRLRSNPEDNSLQVAILWAQDFRAAMFARFMQGIQQQMSQYSKNIRLVMYPYDNGNLCNVQALTSASDCHAAIVCNASTKDIEFLEHTKLFIPIVLYNRYSDQYCSIAMDHRQIGSLAAKAFVANGGKSAVIITTEGTPSDLDSRRESFYETAAQYGLSIENTYYCRGSIAESYGLVISLINKYGAQPLPDCFFCTSSQIAHGLLRALNDKGISVPEQAKIICLGNGPPDEDAYTIPSLSEIAIDMELLAGECLHGLINLCDGCLSAPYTKIFPVEYIPRESCGPMGELPEPVRL